MATGSRRFRPWRLALAPLWVAALATEAKSFAANPIIGSRLLNRWGLHDGRVRLAARVAAARRRRLGAAVAAEDRAAFLRDGFLIKPDFLPAASFDRLRAALLDRSWSVREQRQGPTVTRRAPLSPAPFSAELPELTQLIADPELLALLRLAAAAESRPSFALQAVLTNPALSDLDPQCAVHSDSFHPMAKAWFFFNDVGPDDGPVFYVPGSHLVTPARLAWLRAQSLTAAGNADRDHANGILRIDAANLRRLELPEPRPLTVSANTLIVADTFGFHGRTPRRSAMPRVEIFASMRGNPFLPWPGVSMATLRRRFARFGVAPSLYRPAGVMKIDAPAGL